jgi:hypothetical protein
MMPVMVVIVGITFSSRDLLHNGVGTGGSFEQLVQLSPVQPKTSAGWAVVNFYPLALAHDQGLVFAMGTFHGVRSLFVVAAEAKQGQQAGEQIEHRDKQTDRGQHIIGFTIG